MQMNVSHLITRKLRRIELLVLAVQLAVLVAGFGIWTRHDFTETGKKAKADIEGAGLLLEEHVLRSLAAIDGALLQVADLIGEIGVDDLRSEAAWNRLYSLARPLPPSGAIFIYAPNGDTIAASTSYPPPTFNASDREYFEILVSGKAEHYIGKALPGRTVHKFFFPVARSIKGSDGHVAAVAQIGVEVGYIADLFSRADEIGWGKSFGLYGLSDGAVVVRHPMSEELLSESIAEQPFFAELSGGGSHWSDWTDVAGSKQLLSARRVSGLPLILTASMPHDSVFAPAYDRLLRNGLALLIAMGVLGSLGAMLLLSLRREAQSLEQLQSSEQALRESEERFRLALRNAPVSVAVQDLDLRYIWAYNQRTARPDQIIGHFDHEIFTAEEAAHVTAVKRRVLEEGVELREQMWFNRPSGRIFLDVCWTPIRDSAGRVTGVASATVDLTPIKQAEEALRESETRFRTLYESMAEGVALHEIIYDESGEAIDYRIISANPAFEKHTGLKPEQVEGKPASEAYGMGHAPYIDVFSLVAQSGNPCSFETYFPPMQRHFHISVSSPARNQFVTVFEDITEQKRAEEQLQRENLEVGLINRILRVFTEADGDDLFDRVLEIAQEALASRYGVFGYIGEPGHLFCPSLSKMLDECEIEGKCIHYPPEKWKGLWARALLEKRSIFTNKPPAVPRGHPPIVNNLATPILFRGEVIGLLNLANKESDYTESDQALLEAMADRIAPLLYAWIQKKLREDERARAEGELRQSEARLSAILEQLPVAVGVHNRNGELILSNSRMHHYVPRKIPSRDPERQGRWKAFDPEGRLLAPERWPGARALRGEMVSPGIECLYTDEDGREVWTIVSAVPYLPAGGEPEGAIVVIQDITERKRMEEELRKSRDELELRIQERTAELARTNVALLESERKFRLIAETVEDVFWMNPPGAEVMIYVSPAYEKIWGRSVEDLYRNPKSFIETIHPEDWEVVLSAIEKHRRGEGDHIEYRIVRPDETIRWISDRAYPVHDAAGKVQMMVGVAADITDSKEAEERLRMYAEELERTNRDLSDFSHIAAHDLQEPLRLLVTLGDRLAATCAHCRKSEAQYFIERIQQSAKRSSTFIRDILKYSTVSSHKAAFLETDLNKVVLDVLEEFEEVVEQAGGVMEVGELASLEADRGQIADVFRNLVANALKFSGSEKPRIRIYGEPAGGGKQYRICVEDNGIGFDEAYLDKIFTPFQRLHGKTKFEGSGIGLALCRKIVERHGGSITAKSKPNEGSTFILTLPLSQRGGGGGDLTDEESSDPYGGRRHRRYDAGEGCLQSSRNQE